MDSRQLNISVSHKFVLWAPPRCGSRYTCDTLGQLGLVGGTPRKRQKPVVSHDIGLVPDPGFSYVLLMRNPYTRALSGWAWAKQTDDKLRTVTFSDFLEWHVFDWLFLSSMARRLHPDKPDHILHLERLSKEIPELPFCDRKIEFVSNEFYSNFLLQRPRWNDWYEKENYRQVKSLYAEDFELGGYDPDNYGAIG